MNVVNNYNSIMTACTCMLRNAIAYGYEVHQYVVVDCRSGMTNLYMYMILLH